MNYFDSTPSMRFRPEPDEVDDVDFDPATEEVVQYPGEPFARIAPKPVRYVSDGPCSTHRIVNCPCVGPIAEND